jgi:hypothetical protein
MAAGLTDTIMDMTDIVRLTDAYLDAQKATYVPPRPAN